MASKRTKPEVFGDLCGRCLISSIASYEWLQDGKLAIQKKSGDTITLDFEIDYLAKIAFAKLDSYFKVDIPQAVACDVCSNKDRPDPEETTGSHKRTFCDFCYKGKEHFAAPIEKEGN